MGILVIEFLIKYFNSLFEYDYTKKMEDDLDLIAHGLKEYHISVSYTHLTLPTKRIV